MDINIHKHCTWDLIQSNCSALLGFEMGICTFCIISSGPISGIKLDMRKWYDEKWHNWLVVYLPLWKIWVRQLGWWHSQYMESHKIPWFQTTNQIKVISTEPKKMLEFYRPLVFDDLEWSHEISLSKPVGPQEIPCFKADILSWDMLRHPSNSWGSNFNFRQLYILQPGKPILALPPKSTDDSRQNHSKSMC